MTDRPILFSAPMIKGHGAIPLPDEEIASRYVAGETIAELAAAFSVSRPTLAKALDRAGVKRRPAKQRNGRLSGSKNPAWRGGRRIRRDGYVLLCTAEGERLEHRVVIEKAIGRPLSDSEIVHHCDGDKQNNDPSNLRVMSQSEHARIHAPTLVAARNGHRGPHNPRAKLKISDVEIVRSSLLSGRVLARRFNVHASTIHRIKNGKGWR